jgi:nanoRNase/pAp phosphatase (c-di-AMP/oligoRNAs hydrolase)
MDVDGKAADLEATLNKIKGEPLVILLSGHPDPDSIGSALAHQRICESLGVPSTIAHILPVARPENRALVKLLNIEMLHVSEKRDLEPFRHVALVDTNQVDPNIELPEGVGLISVVDHHRSAPVVDAEFVSIRPALGATCTIYAEYLEAGLAPLQGESEADSRVATALLFGIQTDTDDFTLASRADFHAAAYLKPFCDSPLLRRFGHRTMDARAMDALGRALIDLEVVRDFAFAGVGRVSANNRDAIAIAADFILRREDIDTVLVYGIVDNRIDGSLRTASPSVDPAEFLESAFGKDANGRPYGGGRSDKGGFQIPLGVLADGADTESLWRMVRQVVRSRLTQVVPDLAPSDDRRF